MIKIAETLGEFRDSIVYLRTNCNAKNYPTEFQTYEEGWESLFLSLDHLKGKFDEARFTQLFEMLAQAKAHYNNEVQTQDEEQGFLGSWLMQDIEQVVKGKAPYAYPEHLYRWSR